MLLIKYIYKHYLLSLITFIIKINISNYLREKNLQIYGVN